VASVAEAGSATPVGRSRSLVVRSRAIAVRFVFFVALLVEVGVEVRLVSMVGVVVASPMRERVFFLLFATLPAGLP